MIGQLAHEGFRFDTGPTELLLPAVYRDLFLKTGRRSLEDTVELRELNPSVRHMLPGGGILDLPNASRGAISSAIDGTVGAGASQHWNELMDLAAQVWGATRRPLLEAPVDDPADLQRTPGLPGSLRERMKSGSDTLHGLAKRRLGDARLIAVLEEYALRYGFDPRLAPASLIVLPYMEQTFGTWYVGGGMRALADALFRRCQERRVGFLFDTLVSAVLLKSGRTAGVRLADGRMLRADTVIADVPGERLAVQGWSRPTALPAPGPREGLPAPGRFSVFLALKWRGSAPLLPHRTVVHAPSRRDELHSLFPGVGAGRLCEKPTVTVLRPDDPALRPDDSSETVTLSVPVPPHGVGNGRFDWSPAATAEAYADRLLAHLADAGLEFRDRVLWRGIRTPFDLERDTAAPGGSIKGPALAGGRGAFLRPPNATELPGLYLVGAGAHPGGGLAHVGMSAGIVAELIGPPE
jgi:phytoene desaturase